ncbi:1-deoxy-D-xylulose-5-phosphate synthase N-terminal domain-containing protein [Streptomyces sp. NPDC001930]|uniref:1-deoxy-D-xylulose-5-phosphate synthase N-terminal domain-containing protein n=1 Tax=Streptomyces sp. NPDC001930 TaxID=3364625 RepID=UPI003681053D
MLAHQLDEPARCLCPCGKQLGPPSILGLLCRSLLVPPPLQRALNVIRCGHVAPLPPVVPWQQPLAAPQLHRCLNACGTGGPLGPNPGAVELSLVLRRVFGCPANSLIFDSGLQVYVHKLITIEHPTSVAQVGVGEVRGPLQAT